MNDTEIFKWIGAICVGLSALRLSWVMTTIAIGFVLGKFKRLAESYIYFVEFFDREGKL